MKNKKSVIIKKDNLPIELYKILKLESLVSSGGEGKFVVAEGLVKVNGEVETRKRKKIFSGDIVEYKEECFEVLEGE